MIILTVSFTEQAKEWRFMFKTRERANEVKMLLAGAKNRTVGHATEFGTASPAVKIEDDFGQEAELQAAPINGWTIEDLDLQAECNNHFSLAHARGQARLDEMVQQDPDPALKAMVRRAKMAQTHAQFANGGMGPVPRS